MNTVNTWKEDFFLLLAGVGEALGSLFRGGKGDRGKGPGRKISQEALASQWVGVLQGEEFTRLKKDIFRIVISTYYQKKFTPVDPLKIELSVYDIARSEKDLLKLNKLNDEGWKDIIKEMIVGTLEIMELFEKQEYKGKVRLKVALINIPVLRRASFKLV